MDHIEHSRSPTPPVNSECPSKYPDTLAWIGHQFEWQNDFSDSNVDVVPQVLPMSQVYKFRSGPAGPYSEVSDRSLTTIGSLGTLLAVTAQFPRDQHYRVYN